VGYARRSGGGAGSSRGSMVSPYEYATKMAEVREDERQRRVDAESMKAMRYWH
jgi:hypothetical protein